jgi:tetratricopeptide (TPR) repeat protein
MIRIQASILKNFYKKIEIFKIIQTKNLQKMKKIIVLLAAVFLTVSGISAQTIDELYESGRKAFYADKFDEANGYFMKILAMDSDNFENCYFKGLVYEINFDYENAIKEFTSAIKFNKDCAECYKARGRVYEKQEKFDLAMTDYKTSIKNNKTDSESNFKLASLYQDQLKYKEAIKYYSKYLKLQPDNDIAYYNRGLCYQELKENNKAKADFEKAVSIDKIWEKTLRPVIESLGN